MEIYQNVGMNWAGEEAFKTLYHEVQLSITCFPWKKIYTFQFIRTALLSLLRVSDLF